jgi:hypothetical protein
VDINGIIGTPEVYDTRLWENQGNGSNVQNVVMLNGTRCGKKLIPRNNGSRQIFSVLKFKAKSRKKEMKQKTANTSLSIKIITLIVLLLTACFLAAAFFKPVFLIPGFFLGVVSWLCYLFAPVAYELSGNKLYVLLHFGKKEFGPVVKCSKVTERLPFTLRLFGNGGLFAGTGIFWNKIYGVFRVYVTSARYSDWVLVETEKQKIVISPEEPERFIQL